MKCKPNNKDKKLKLVEILGMKDIGISKVFIANDCFAILTVNKEHADDIFKTKTKQELASHNFTPIKPHNLRAIKSVIIPRVDDVMCDESAVHIAEEISSKNTWLGEELEGVYKFPNSPTIKLTFSQTILAKRCTEI